MRQRGFGLIVYAVLALGILLALGSLIWWADANIETSAGVKKGEANIRAEWAEANRLQREKEAAQAGTAAENLEVKREKAKVVYRTITQAVDRVVEKPVYRNVCLEPDGLRLARCAIRGESTDTCKPDKPVPSPSGPDGRLGSFRLKVDYQLGRDVPGLLGQASGVD